MIDLQPHPLAEIFPLMEGAEFDALVADIEANGLREKIKIYEGKILDGRNRYRAAIAAGLFERETPIVSGTEIFIRHFGAFTEWDGHDPLAYVISHNLRRRHLNDDQRRLAAARLASMPRGRPTTENGSQCAISRSAAAALLSVDDAGVKRARAALASAEPEIIASIDRGKLSVNAAAQATKLSVDQQREIARRADAGEANAVRTALKKGVRAAREIDLATKQRALPVKRYGVIVADPEWRFEPFSRETGLDRAADNHYPTSEIADISARDVASIAAEDCTLFLWATAPMLPQQLGVMEAWGFSYKSNFVWRKDVTGTGYWNRNEHEHLLIGTRGSVPAPAPGTQWASVIEANVAGHSAKPERFLELVEAYFPNLPKIELNRRGPPRANWDAWGNEAEQ